MKIITLLSLIILLSAAANAQDVFAGFKNQGLVGVGRIPADAFDVRGANVDTIGGVFSSMAVDRASVKRDGNAYAGVLYGLADRGYGNGEQDYRPRLERFKFAFTPYYGQTATTAQNQIALINDKALLFHYQTNAGGVSDFTGFDADDKDAQDFPRSSTGGLGQGRRSFDPEGLAVIANNGGYWVSEEYGPFIYRFDVNGLLVQTLPVPAAFIPKVGAKTPRQNYFTALKSPDAGRFENRGLEGLSLTPDGKRLIAMMQSPLTQDGDSKNKSRNTRILIYDVDRASPNFNKLVGEYVYVLTLNGENGRSTPISEIYALNDHQFLVLERDALGLGADKPGASGYKKVNVADISNATNIANSGLDLEPGTKGALFLPKDALPAAIKPAARFDFVDLIDRKQLAKFGLNANAKVDQNTVSEKQEGLALFSVNEPNAPNDYFLFVGNDNDFKAAKTYHNGRVVGTNSPTVDTTILAFRITLPAALHP